IAVVQLAAGVIMMRTPAAGVQKNAGGPAVADVAAGDAVELSIDGGLLEGALELQGGRLRRRLLQRGVDLGNFAKIGGPLEVAEPVFDFPLDLCIGRGRQGSKAGRGQDEKCGANDLAEEIHSRSTRNHKKPANRMTYLE